MPKPRWIAPTFAVLLVIAMAADGSTAGSPPSSPLDIAGWAGPAGSAITLVTGDRVTVTPTGAGRPGVAIEPARWPGRRVSFHTTYVDGAVRVVPSDVAHLVPDALDPQLFDVSGLIRAGHDDATTPDLPLIVRGLDVARGLSRAAGRSLPSIGATATNLPKARAAELGATLAGTATGTALAGGPRIWLDAKVHGGELDANLTQVGAPAAWSAGLSGAGVRVAVLDTGVDDAHPDLAGRVAAEENFTPSPVADDRNGHGTHVASLVAGSGAAAGGARRGVAFGATLLSGKVLDDTGTGQFSWIIAGLEWAAAHGAKVVTSAWAPTRRAPVATRSAWRSTS